MLSLLVGVPLFTFHSSLGQLLGAGVMDMWRISPIFKVRAVVNVPYARATARRENVYRCDSLLNEVSRCTRRVNDNDSLRVILKKCVVTRASIRITSEYFFSLSAFLFLRMYEINPTVLCNRRIFPIPRLITEESSTTVWFFFFFFTLLHSTITYLVTIKIVRGSLSPIGVYYY